MSIALKFTSLFLRTLAKPIANSIKSQAHEHASFRRKCIAVAQRMHKTEIMLRRNLLNEKDQKVKPLNDARAIQTGANFVAETFVFSVAGALILFESWRSRRKEKTRQASVADDIRLLQDEISWIKDQLERSTIIKHGDNPPVPKDLHLSVLKFSEENSKKTVEESTSSHANASTNDTCIDASNGDAPKNIGSISTGSNTTNSNETSSSG